MTAAQSGMWFAQRLGSDNPIYNGGQYLEIEGRLDGGLFERALRQVVRETDALRTGFLEDADGVWQLVDEDLEHTVHHVDVSGEADPQAAAETWMRSDLARPVDLAGAGPEQLATFALIRTGPDRFLWYLRCHHIALDGFGCALVTRRAAEVYTALAEGRTPEAADFPPLSALVAADGDYRASDNFTKDKEFWAARLADRPEPRGLTGRQAPVPQRLIRSSAFLTPETTQALRRAGSDAGIPWPAVLTAVFAAYLQGLIGGDEVLLGLPVTTRVGKVARATPGMVSNVLPLRLSVRPEMTLTTLLTEVAREMRRVLRHQRYRYEDLRRDLGLVGDDQRLVGPQINIMMFGHGLDFGGAPATAHTLNLGPVEDLSVVVYDHGEGQNLRIDFEGSPDLYTEPAIRLHHERFARFLDALTAAAAERPIGSLETLLPAERAQVLKGAADELPAYPEQTVPELFQAQVRRDPEATAVVFRDTSVSYGELNARANRLARLLTDRGVGPEHYVALVLPRSVDVLVAILAVMKAGAAYIPVDPDYPADRIAHVLDDSRPSLVVALEESLSALPDQSSVPRIVLDAPGTLEELSAFGGENLPQTESLSSLHPAYVIYTSGSTGRPKGVVVPQGNVVRLFSATDG
ncbi:MULTISPECIES: condensation domain-containing protein, partial [unclassified Streptomyces]|uniref:condensation domain-containing protein n=1 Tax=unclassified Streptomyces TaxID=2593676 RepID=UPI00379987C4